MKFTKTEKEFMAAVTSWAVAQGASLNEVRVSKTLICYHWLNLPGRGVIMCQAGKNQKEALWHACVKLHSDFSEVMDVKLPDIAGQLVIKGGAS